MTKTGRLFSLPYFSRFKNHPDGLQKTVQAALAPEPGSGAELATATTNIA